MDTPLPLAKRRVELMLDTETVRRAECFGEELSSLVERLLRQHVQAEAARDARAREHARFSSAFVERHGFWGEEFSTL